MTLALSFPLATARDLVYLVAIVGFILALKGLGSPKYARRGNQIGAGAAALAVAMTFTLPELRHSGTNLVLALVAMALGALVAVPVARGVKMTAMPQLVAIFNGVGGGAAALISIVELLHLHSLHILTIGHSTGGAVHIHSVSLHPATYITAEVLLGVLIGSVSFSGSAIAFIKLQELITGRPITYPGQQVINALVGVAIGVLVLVALITGSIAFVFILLVLALVLGVIFVLPIGGADVPVLISLLNSFTGLAVAASGFVLDNNLLIVAGTLVGASGIILTRLMSSAMGRSLPNILFSAFGSVITATGGEAGDASRPVRSGTAEDVGVLLAYARKVVIIPGYGLAVAQAQHTARELADALMARGVEVFYAIHPVAGRMPGHMNVLLAEANVPYDELKEMDEANLEMSTADVALVVGANDTVNPAAKTTPGSPIYGMPIIHADEAENIIFLKRSMRPGFAGIDNELLYDPKTTMLFGDAKDTLQKLVAAVAEA
jgi:H+-translocating NAD(P) transhydrogenase subunit beta